MKMMHPHNIASLLTLRLILEVCGSMNLQKFYLENQEGNILEFSLEKGQRFPFLRNVDTPEEQTLSCSSGFFRNHCGMPVLLTLRRGWFNKTSPSTKRSKTKEAENNFQAAENDNQRLSGCNAIFTNEAVKKPREQPNLFHESPESVSTSRSSSRIAHE